MKRRIFPWLLILSLLGALLVPAGGAGLTKEVDLSDGSIEFVDGGYIQNDVQTNWSNDYALIQSDAFTENTVTVSGGTHTVIVTDTVNIDVSTTDNVCAFAIASGASVDLVLEQEMILKSGSNMAGLQVPSGASLTISATTDTGSIKATAGENGAGIGGSYDASTYVLVDCGDVTIPSGRVTGQGGSNGAGIGGAWYGDGTAENGTISLQGGIVTATGGYYGAGIGGGRYGDGTGTNGLIEIAGTASVTAVGSDYSAGIGGGGAGTTTPQRGHGTGEYGAIVISGNAKVKTSGHTGIGGGYYSSSGVSRYGAGTASNGLIQICGNSYVEATGSFGAGIGGSTGAAGTGESGVIEISEQATVLAVSENGAGIGGGNGSGGNAAATSGKIEIKGDVVVTANSTGTSNAAIGGHSVGGTIDISGGTVTADGYAVGIGGYYATGSGTINIAGGHITATGLRGFGTAELTNFYGGHVEAASTSTSTTSAHYAIAGPMASGPTSNAWIVAEGVVGTNTDFVSGVLFVAGEGSICGGGAVYTLPESKVIPEGYTLTVEEGQTLIIPEGITLTVNGKLIIKGTVIEKETGGVLAGDTGFVSGFDHDHDLEEEAGKPAVCNETGIVPHWHCRNCGMNLDYETKEELETIVAEIDENNHCGLTQTLKAVEPGCETVGYTGDVYCEGCGDQLETSREVPARGHRYENDVCTVCGERADPSKARFALSCGVGHEGETVTLELSMVNNPGVVAVGLDVNYDTDQLKLVKVEDTQVLNACSASLEDVSNVPYGLYWVDTEAKDNNEADGVIAKLTFEVMEGCTAGDTWVEMTYTAGNVVDAGQTPVTFVVSNGKVEIHPALLGDVDGDGDRDNTDVLELAKYLVDPARWLVKKAADVDCDGSVTMTDLGLLTRFVAKWPGVELGAQAQAASLAEASEPGTISVSSGVGATGDQVQVTVSLDEASGVALARLELDYDTGLLKLVKVENRSTLGQFVVTEDLEQDPVKLLWNGAAVENCSMEGELAVLTFEVIAQEGTAQVDMRCGSGDVLDGSLQPVEVQVSGGVIEIVGNDKVELKADAFADEDGSLVVDAVVTGKVNTVSGLLCCAAYDGSGRMLDFVSQTVTVEKGVSVAVCLEPDCAYDEAAKIKLFFVDDGYAPLTQAWEP